MIEDLSEVTKENPIWEALENNFGEGKWGGLEEALLSLVGR